MSGTSESTMAEWLLKADWRAISAHLAANGAHSAVDFKARALMRIQMTQGQVDWNAAVGDLSRVCEMEPHEATHWANLCQALLDARRPQEAFLAARRAALLAPAAIGMVEKVMVSATAAGCQMEALSLLREMRATVAAAHGDVPISFDQAIEDLESRWWEPLEAGAVRLRRVRNEDEEFLMRLFSDRDFMQQYNLFQERSLDAVRAFVDTAQLPPRMNRRIEWIIEEPDGRPVGIASFTNMDLINRRAEAMFGYPGAGDGTKKVAAAVAAIEFAFDRLRLHKLVSHVYANNLVSQKFTLGLGFRQEGVLKEHVRLGPDAGWIDLYVNGLLKEDFLAGRYGRRTHQTK